MADLEEQKGAKDEVVSPAPGTPEYEAAMAAKVDENAAKAAAAASGGELVEATAEATEDTEKKPDDTPEGDEAKKAVEAAGIDYAKLQTEYADKGELSEESLEALEKAGFPREVVSEYVAGQEALSELRVIKAAEAVGGKEALSKMQEWGATALSPAELEAYNKGVDGSQEEMLQAVNGLKARYESAYGRQPALLGGSPTSQGPSGYASQAEMTKDMRDPRYSKDPAFRAKVAAKVGATTAF